MSQKVHGFSCKFKKKAFYSTYQAKYIVIKKANIRVFNNEKEYKNRHTHGNTPSVTIHTSGALVSIVDESSPPSKDHTISIQLTNNKTEYMLCFPSKEECHVCFRTIKLHQQRYKTRGHSRYTPNKSTPFSIRAVIKQRWKDKRSLTSANSVMSATTETNDTDTTERTETKTDQTDEDESYLRPYRGSITVKSPNRIANIMWSQDELKAPMMDIPENANTLDVPMWGETGSNYSNSSRNSIIRRSTSLRSIGSDTRPLYISSSSTATHTGFYKFNDGVITIARIVKQPNRLTLQCDLVTHDPKSHLRQAFIVKKDDQRICRLNKADIEESHRNIWKKWMILLRAKYRYYSVFDDEPFKTMTTCVKRHPQLLFTIRYDNWRTPLQHKTHEHIIQSLFSYLLSVKCQNHRNEDTLKLDCNCRNAVLFSKYSYYLLMAIFGDGSEPHHILQSVQKGRSNTHEAVIQICSLLSDALRHGLYFKEYQTYIEDWLHFDFYNFVCGSCQCLNNTIMIHRIFHYAAKSIFCRVCGVYEMDPERKLSKPSMYRQCVDLYEDPERKEGANRYTQTQDDEYSNYEMGNFIRYNVLSPRYESLFRECTLNEISAVPKAHLDQYLEDAKICHENISFIVVCTTHSKNYGMTQYAPIDVAHILALIIYTEEILYSKWFTKSYLSLSCTDANKVIQHHCNHWYWFGRYLFEAIEFFGNTFDCDGWNTNHKLFEGSVTWFNFDSFTFPLHFPRSIAIIKSRAQEFATDRGVVIELIPKYKSVLNNIKCINPYLVSHEYDQQMRLLFGRHGAVQLRDVMIQSMESVSLQQYIAALCYLEKVLSQTIFDTTFYNASHLYADLDKIQDILYILINICVDLHKVDWSATRMKIAMDEHFPSVNDQGMMYIMHLMKYWCNKTEMVTFEAFEYENQYLSQNLRAFFIKKQSTQIHVINLRSLLPNLKYFRNCQNMVQCVQCECEYQYEDADMKHEDAMDHGPISQVLPHCAKHEVPNLIRNVLDNVEAFRGVKLKIEPNSKELRDRLMQYYEPISKSVEATLQDFVDVTNKIDVFDNETGNKLSEYLYEKLLSDTERIKPWTCDDCWFKNRKMMIGGYFRFYNRLHFCGLCGQNRFKEDKKRNKKRHASDVMIHCTHMGRFVNENKLSLPHLEANWKHIKDKECHYKPNQVYLAKYDGTGMVELLTRTIAKMNLDILNKNEQRIIECFTREEMDGRKFIALNRKSFTKLMVKQLGNKMTKALVRLYSHISKMNMNCNAMKRITLIIEQFNGLTKNLHPKTGRYPYRWRQFIASLDQYSHHDLVSDVHHIFEHNRSSNYFFDEQPDLKCAAHSHCKHLSRTQSEDLLYSSLVEKQQLFQCNDWRDFVYIRYFDAIHCVILHQHNAYQINESENAIKKNGTYQIYETGVLIQYDASSPLYCTLRDEMIDNTVYDVTEYEWNELIDKTQSKMKTKEWKKQTRRWIATEKDERYGVSIGDLLSIEHLLCITSYCTNTTLCFQFRASYRSRDYDDNNTNIKTFHRNHFYWLGRFIYVAITFFGKTPSCKSQSRRETFYHGLCETFLFNEFSTIFEIPTSTSTSFHVARERFTAQGAGIVLELSPKFNVTNLSKCLDVSKISGYGADENERLFAGMTNILAIIDIQVAFKRKWYKSREHCQMFLYFERIMEQTIHQKDFYNYGRFRHDEDLTKWKELQKTHLLPLIKHQMGRHRLQNDAKLTPHLLYIYALFEHFCDSKRGYVNLSCITQEMQWMHDDIKGILFKIQSRKINETNLKLIFPNLRAYKNERNEWRKLIGKTESHDTPSKRSSVTDLFKAQQSEEDEDQKENDVSISAGYMDRLRLMMRMNGVLSPNDKNNQSITSPTLTIDTSELNLKYELYDDDNDVNADTDADNDMLNKFRAPEWETKIARIVSECGHNFKNETARNHFFIGKTIAKYYRDELFNDYNTVVIVSLKGKLPQISDNDASVVKFDRTFEDKNGNLLGKDIRVCRVIEHKPLAIKQQQHTEGSTFQIIVMQLSRVYDDVNKIAQELTKIYGEGCHVARSAYGAYGYNIYCGFKDGLIARVEFDSNTSFVIAWILHTL
eukprot:61692_1